VHATAIGKTCCAPDGLGIRCKCQWRPLHRSASGAVAPDLLTQYPTAMQEDRLGHDTPPSELTADPAGFGVFCTVHLLPFHRSARVAPIPDPVT